MILQPKQKQFMSVVFGLTAVIYSGGEAVAAQNQDMQARLLADIAFQYADLEQSQRSLDVLDQAQRSVAEMTDICFQANPLTKVAGGYRLVGQNEQGKTLLAKAIQTAQTQEATGCSGSATSPTESLVNRAHEYAEDGHLELAIELSQGLKEPMLMAELAGDLFEAGQPRRARNLLNQAIDLAKGIEDSFYATQMLTVMANRLRLAGHSDQAQRVLEQALESSSTFDLAQSEDAASSQLNAILSISRELVAAQAQPQALELLAQIRPQIETLASPFPADRFVYWVDAALQYADLGQQPEAEAILATALAAAEAMPKGETQTRDDALSRVANGYIKLGDIDRGLNINASIQSANARAGVVREATIAHAAADDLDAAIALARSTGQENLNLALTELARYYLAQNQPDQAWEIVQTQSVQGVASEVAVGYLEAEQPEQALEVVKTSELEGFAADVALAYAKAGQPEQAAAGQLDYLRPAIARELAQQKQFDSALQVAQSITDDIYKAQALIAIAQAYGPTAPAERGLFQSLLANLASFLTGGAGDSERQKAIEVLEQALQITRSL
ncbi:hypothetical protein IQ273_30565 [Nodosilinea sp. LEGE 07298]|uniref:hypothetical protein n=1 Tax=Nodosilinea sp. LEGE 07298 TaxID=2777970 RepID=UPI00188030D8|nr:hypothetical protein [Nodosilinea sp. LEGE 07298]MBE9113720.1 hypothetical protein [Nodosilinea sp. LEGE 07298]